MSVSGRSHPKQTADSPSLSTCTLPPPPACLHWILCVWSCSCAVNAVSPWILLKSTAILQNLFLAGSVSWSSLPCECTSWYKAGDGKVWLGLHLIKKKIYRYLLLYRSFLRLYWISQPVLQMDQGYRVFLEGKMSKPRGPGLSRRVVKETKEGWSG